MGIWDTLSESLEVQAFRDVVAKLRPDDLDGYEARTGLKLPESYREFVLRFGPGELASTFQIAAPGYARYDVKVDLDRLTPWFRRVSGLDTRSDAELANTYDDPARARRVVLFCTTFGGDYYGWDPQDVNDPAAPEYAVYILARHDTRVRKVADSFRAFIEDYCLGDGYPREIGEDGWNEDDLGPRMVYAPQADIPADA
jgi:hypothetical protein